MTSLLEELRGLSTVDCDTLDADVARAIGPFADCTSNQAIAYGELTKVGGDGKPVHRQLILESIEVAHWMFGKQSDASLEELAVELMMVGLSIRIIPETRGFLHVQTNPKLAYSTQKTIRNAERIISHFKHLAPDFDPKRICIKIPSTWEGIQACRELERRGIATLATTLFCIEQAALAAEAGCRYVAPYVNELRVHFEPGYMDANKGAAIILCGVLQEFFSRISKQTNSRTPEVVAASLTSIDEIMQLAGIRHITISPPLLAQLENTPAAGWTDATVGLATRFSDYVSDISLAELGSIVHDEARWRMAVTRSENGLSESKLVQALNIFADMQDRLEGLVREANVLVR
ncbi:hypothetical protein QBC35DRAFT_233195 [Podospora australis]|uniref:Transaldolase n=1 Tax=Podospora australis TaxID=1536484 RepID=A0AAN6WSR5_9PEZI|nr:hypothetical protein QBC35DRAFT_233195 [Podospora australis]